MSNQLKLFLYIVFVVAIFVFVQNKFNIFNVKLIDNNQKTTTENTTTQSTSNPDATVVTPQNYVDIVTGANKSVRVNVEVANTAEEKALGLSFRKYLGDYDGMLFTYDTSTNNPFSMKDMQISLDLIFVDSQYFIVDAKTYQSPCTTNYCPSIYSKSPYQYVLEVNSGFCEKNGIAEGGSFVLYLESVN